jgi:dienelactone hydrolase
MPVAQDAPVAAGAFGVIVVPHGGGGMALLHRDLTMALALRGDVVAAPTHPRGKGDDISGVSGWVGRPRPVSRVIDAVLDDGELGAHIERERIGLVAHSNGGHTALARVRSIVLMAPNAVQFTDDALARVTIPVLVYAAEKDNLTRVQYHGERLAKTLPRSHLFVRLRFVRRILMDTQIIVAFIFGVAFIVTMLALAIFFPRPEPFQYMVFRVTLALAAAGVAAMIPGFISLNINPSAAVVIRAGGAVAVFLIVYFLSPAAVVAEAPRSHIVTVSTEALKSLQDLDNAIRRTVGPVARFDYTSSAAAREDAITRMGELADTQEILPRVRQLMAQLGQVRKSIDADPEETKLADIVFACGEATLQALGPSEVTPWPGPRELAHLMTLIRTANTQDAEKMVREEAEKVYAVVNRQLLMDADRALGGLSGKR